MSENPTEKNVHRLSRYRKSVWVFGCLTCAAALFAGWLFWWNDAVTIEYPHASTIILDQHGSRIGEVLSSDGQRHLPLTYGEIPPMMVNGLIALEDRGFRSHAGISITGLARSSWNNLRVRFGYATGIQ